MGHQRKLGSYGKNWFLDPKPKFWAKSQFGQFGPGHAGLFSALLVGWLVVVARGLYLARHLFTLLPLLTETTKTRMGTCNF